MKKMRKAKLTAVFGTIAVLALLSTGTLAYFTTQAEVERSVTTGKVSLVVHPNDADKEKIAGESAEIMPGDTVPYTVTVENTGNADVYLRVKLTKYVKDGGVSGNDALDLEESMTVEINKSAWTERTEDSGEVYYYYNTALSGNAETEPLFREVTFEGSAMGNEYLGKKLALKVAAYGVQSKNNAGRAVDAFGWPEEKPDAEGTVEAGAEE